MTARGGYQKLIRYKVKAEKAQENVDLIQSLFAALERSKPDNLRYVAFQLKDGLSFLHIALVTTEDGSNPMQQFDEFHAFTHAIADRCDEPPAFSELTTIGAHALF